MTLPPFDTRGLLPPSEHGGGYLCAVPEVKQRFVTDLGATPTPWRTALFEGWEVLHATVRSLVPSAWWWLWGCFVSNHVEPLWGELEVLSAVVVLPVEDLPKPREHGEMLLSFIQGAERKYRVDAGFVFEFQQANPNYVETLEALEYKWRPRAMLGVPDHRTREKEPAGFLEVRP